MNQQYEVDRLIRQGQHARIGQSSGGRPARRPVHYTLTFWHQRKNAIGCSPEWLEIGCRITDPEDDRVTVIMPALLDHGSNRTGGELPERPAIKPSEIDDVAAHIRTAIAGLAFCPTLWNITAMSASIHQFLIGSDNYGILIHDEATGATATIDAGEAAPILAALKETGWTLTDIWVTHHHGDHVAGIPELKAATGAKVTAPLADQDRVPLVDRGVQEGDRVTLGATSANIIETPGHTSNHIAYHCPDDAVLFAGDTLFSLGCGRLFEGTPAQMWASLQKLRALPPATKLYCGHEYTQSNARFALTIDPENAALKQRAREVEALRAKGAFTLPSTIGAENAENPFLRADDPLIASRLGMPQASPVEIFAELRARKNRA
jgi:hydroxyacylglutathione hydrolase